MLIFIKSSLLSKIIDSTSEVNDRRLRDQISLHNHMWPWTTNSTTSANTLIWWSRRTVFDNFCFPRIFPDYRDITVYARKFIRKKQHKIQKLWKHDGSKRARNVKGKKERLEVRSILGLEKSTYS